MKVVIALSIFIYIILPKPTYSDANVTAICQADDVDLDFGKFDPLSVRNILTESELSVHCMGGMGGEFIELEVSADADTWDAETGSQLNSKNNNGAIEIGVFSDRNLTRPIGRSLSRSLILRGKFDEAGRVNFTSKLFGRVAVDPAIAVGKKFGRLSISLHSAAGAIVATSKIHAQVEVVASCVALTANTLDFGVIDDLKRGVSASSMISLQCTMGTPVTIGLGMGLNAVDGGSQRYLTNGSYKLAYQLYADQQKSKVWGNLDRKQGVEMIGSGKRSTLSVFGQVLPHANAPVGVYYDRVTVTITY